MSKFLHTRRLSAQKVLFAVFARKGDSGSCSVPLYLSAGPEDVGDERRIIYSADAIGNQ